MTIPLQIVFRDVDHSDAVEARIKEKAEKLARYRDRITNCRVTVSTPHRHSHKGQKYDVRIDLHVPGEAIHVHQEGKDNPAHEDIYVALRDAFGAALRQLEDWQRKQLPG